jgi:capsular polysaccharide biosynthesis protein
MLSMYEDDPLSERLDAGDYTYLEDGTTDLPTGLATLGFIRSVLGRTKRLWCAFAVLAMLIAVAVAAALPPSYQATTSLLLTPETTAGEVASTCCPASGPIYNEQTIASSRAVAALAMQMLGLNESINSFLKTYTVATVTDRVILITASAKSADAAVSHVSAIAAAFLQFRANLANNANALVAQQVNQQLNQAEQSVKSLNAQISQVETQPPSSAQTRRLKKLKDAVTLGNLNVANLQAADAANESTSQVSADTIIKASRVLNPASLTPPHSKLKRLVEYAFLGLFAGLVLSMGVIVAGALMSDKLRRRDDIAQALGAPVQVSTPPVRLGRGRGLTAARNVHIRRIVAYLDKTTPASPRGPASLAVVPVDDVQVAAACVASLAVSRAQRGLRVVMADLCRGAPAARMLGSKSPGVQAVSVEGAQLTVVVPDRDDILPTGPLQRTSGRARAAEPLVNACESADLLFSLVPVDPSLGAEHLTGWTNNVIAMVTAGKSTAARIHTAGEMVRLAGMTLICGVLVGADRNDESLGTSAKPIDGTEDPLRSDVAGLFVTSQGPGARRTSDD